MECLIDRVRYAPMTSRALNIGIAIITHNRGEVLSRALVHHPKHLPAGALVVLIEHGSSKLVRVPVGMKLILCDMSRGILAHQYADRLMTGHHILQVSNQTKFVKSVPGGFINNYY